MLQDTEQTKEKMCIAFFNRYLHANNICPANHDVEVWGDGIFGMDGEEVVNYAVYNKAVECWEAGDDVVLYSSTYNSYVMAPF